ncbi:MAG: hypothetical protein Q8P71_00420 [bacterium]|nr:hypothetical protein [bacterium]
MGTIVRLELRRGAKKKREAVNVLSEIEWRLGKIEETACAFNTLLVGWSSSGILYKTLPFLSLAEYEGIRTKFEAILSEMEKVQEKLLS